MDVLKFNKILIMLCFISLEGFSQVGINTNTPLSTLDIYGNLTIKEVGIANANVSGSGPLNGGPNASKTAISDGIYISLTPTSGNTDFVLPDAVANPGRIYILRNISNSVNAYIYSNGGSFFAKDSSGATSAPVTMPFNSLLKTIIFISDGANWTYIF